MWWPAKSLIERSIRGFESPSIRRILILIKYVIKNKRQKTDKAIVSKFLSYQEKHTRKR